MAATATIRLATDRSWLGDSRLGTFTIYLDGQKAGVILPNGQFVVQCEAGRRVLRARQWWYLSARLSLNVEPNASIDLKVDVDRGWLGMLRLTFAPWRALAIWPVQDTQAS